MQILVTNDDGIMSEGLWELVRELALVARVTVVAPDRERSAIGTAVTLRQPLRTHKIKSAVPGVEAYSVDGTPSDSVILGLGKLVVGGADVVVSGINQDSNLGEDVHISGTVSAALQAYLRGVPAIAISAPYGSETGLEIAAKVAAVLAPGMAAAPARLFLNVNLPHRALPEISGVKITQLASRSHINTVEEGSHGRQKYYWLERQRVSGAADSATDIWAIEQGHISITPLYADHSQEINRLVHGLCDGLLQQLVGK